MTSNEPEPRTPEPEIESPAVAPGESRQERARRFGRTARLYSGAVAFIALLTVLIILVSKNTAAVKLDWAVGSTRASLVWIVLAAAVLGWLLGLATAVVLRHRARRRRG